MEDRLGRRTSLDDIEHLKRPEPNSIFPSPVITGPGGLAALDAWRAGKYKGNFIRYMGTGKLSFWDRCRLWLVKKLNKPEFTSMDGPYMGSGIHGKNVRLHN